MKKSLLSLAALLVMASSAFAQQAETVTSTKTTYQIDESQVLVNEFSKNWDFSFAIGTQAYLGEYTDHTKFIDVFSLPAIDLSLQKWSSPYFGLGINLFFTTYKGLYSSGDAKNATFADFGNDAIYRSTTLYRMKGAYIDIFANASFDITNILCGYDSARKFNLIGSIGGGVLLPVCKTNYYAVGAAFNAGLTGRFKISPKWAIDINLRGALVGDSFNGISFSSSGDKTNIPLDGTMGLTIGATYKMGFKKHLDKATGAVAALSWLPVETAIIESETLYKEVEKVRREGAMEVAKVNAKLDVAMAEVENQKGLVSAKQREVEKLQKEYEELVIDYWQIAHFEISKYELTNKAKIHLCAAAAVIKACPEKKFVIEGYCDQQTGRVSYNQKLSVNRAKAAYDFLIAEGVNPDQLSYVGKGGVDFMYYNDKKCSRAVIIRMEK